MKEILSKAKQHDKLYLNLTLFLDVFLGFFRKTTNFPAINSLPETVSFLFERKIMDQDSTRVILNVTHRAFLLPSYR